LEFEWDEAKRASNLDKHGIDFIRAGELFDGRPVFSYASPRSGEPRNVTVGRLEGRLVAVVWIERGGVTRIISVRRARRGETTKYETLYR
jgi:hypothetical protein